MYTQCPSCSTFFRITTEQLQAAGGKVRCGECHGVFYAPDHLTENLPAEIRHAAPASRDEPLYETLLRETPLPEEPQPAAAEEPPQETGHSLSSDLDELFDTGATTAPADIARDTPLEPPAEDAGPLPLPPADPYGEEDIEALLKHTPPDPTTDNEPAEFELPWDDIPADMPPAGETAALDADPASLDIDTAPDTVDDFDLPEPELTTARSVAGPAAAPLSPLSAMLADEAATPPRSRLLAGSLWTLGSLLLLATLVMQYLYLNRAMVVHYPELRPLLETLCDYTGCQLPARRDLGALTLLERDIRSHEQYQGALMISATLLNRATFAQPYPAVEVVMRDLGGKVVAARRFQPQEYLPGDATPHHLLAPQGTAQLVLDVTDPGSEAVGFEFTFH